jgi:hypothetical protein
LPCYSYPATDSSREQESLESLIVADRKPQLPAH